MRHRRKQNDGKKDGFPRPRASTSPAELVCLRTASCGVVQNEPPSSDVTDHRAREDRVEEDAGMQSCMTMWRRNFRKSSSPPKPEAKVELGCFLLSLGSAGHALEVGVTGGRENEPSCGKKELGRSTSWAGSHGWLGS